MVSVPDEAAELRDKAFACEAQGNMSDAMRFWEAAIKAAEYQVSLGVSVADLEWLRRRLAGAQSTAYRTIRNLDEDPAG